MEIPSRLPSPSARDSPASSSHSRRAAVFSAEVPTGRLARNKSLPASSAKHPLLAVPEAGSQALPRDRRRPSPRSNRVSRPSGRSLKVVCSAPAALEAQEGSSLGPRRARWAAQARSASNLPSVAPANSLAHSSAAPRALSGSRSNHKARAAPAYSVKLPNRLWLRRRASAARAASEADLEEGPSGRRIQQSAKEPSTRVRMSTNLRCRHCRTRSSRRSRTSRTPK